MVVRFVVVPEWQGSGSARAMRLLDGAEAIRGDLPAASTTVVDVPLEAGDSEGTGIARFSLIRVTRQRFARAVEGLPADSPLVTIGGDCGTAYPAMQHAAARGPFALVWFDAHPDANSADTSTSGIFNGMVLRAVVDDGHVAASRVVLAGTRVWDDPELEWTTAQGIPSLSPDELADPDRLVAAIEATGATSVYLHIDLDVLDPSEIDGLADPQPFGVSVAQLVAAIRAVRARFALAGAGIAQFSPASPDAALEDLPGILRLVGAITSGV